MDLDQHESQIQQPEQYRQPTAAPYSQQPTIVSPDQVEQIRRTNKRKLVWGLICLIAPIALCIIGILSYMIINPMLGDTTPESVTSMSEPTSLTDTGENSASAARTILNVVLFIIGAISVLTILPGVIVGIILLATRKKI